MTPFKLVIPARYASARFPGKLLKEVAGKTILEYAFGCGKQAGADEVIVTTGDSEIKKAALSFGARVVESSPKASCGTERAAEVAEVEQWSDETIVVNLQGDVAFLPSAWIQQTVDALVARPHLSVATPCISLKTVEELQNPNIVKLVRDVEGRALYFTRAPVPWVRQDEPLQNDQLQTHYHHLGVYVYRVAALKKFSVWGQSPLEKLEKLEQLRFLSHGEAVHVEVIESKQALPPSIDSEEDLRSLECYISQQS